LRLGKWNSKWHAYSILNLFDLIPIYCTQEGWITALDYSFSYDDKGRLSGSTLATGGSNIYEMTMGYNAAGGITSRAVRYLPYRNHELDERFLHE